MKNIFKRKRLTVNPKTRFRATARQAAHAITSLYYPNPNEAKLVAKELGKRATLSKVKSAKTTLDGKVWIPDAELNSKNTRFTNRFLRRDLTHELAHSSGLSKNHFVTARALEYYLEYFGKVVDRLGAMDNNHSIHLAYSKRGEIIAKERAKQANLEKKGITLSEFEHTAQFLKSPFSNLGKRLATTAMKLDAEMQKPGAGAILIREVSQGKKIEQTTEEIKNGKYNQEIKNWLTANPAVKRLLKK
ncbi:MAG: hypothetical protein WCW44_00535 [archaeon]|jgi:hypothetical protein